MATARTLVVVHGSGLPLTDLQSLISSHGVTPDSAEVTTEPAALAATGTAAAAYSRALVLSRSADAALLGAVAKLLQPGSSVIVQLQGAQVRPACGCCVMLCEPVCMRLVASVC